MIDGDDLIGELRPLCVVEAQLRQAEVAPGEYASGTALLQGIVAAWPQLAPLADSMVLAVNEDYVDMDSGLTLRAADEVALIPPLSGG